MFFMGNPTVTDKKSEVLGLRVPMMCFRPWSYVGMGWDRPLLDWVTESVTDPVNSGGHDTGGGREFITRVYLQHWTRVSRAEQGC